MRAVYGLYPDGESAQQAVNRLRAAGIVDRDITVISAQPMEDYEFGEMDKDTWMWWLACLGGLIGMALGFGLSWVTETSWPINVGGLPTFAWWPNLIIMFELTMRGAVVATAAAPGDASPHGLHGVVAHPVVRDNAEVFRHGLRHQDSVERVLVEHREGGQRGHVAAAYVQDAGGGELRRTSPPRGEVRDRQQPLLLACVGTWRPIARGSVSRGTHGQEVDSGDVVGRSSPQARQRTRQARLRQDGRRRTRCRGAVQSDRGAVAAKIEAGNEFQRVPLRHLAETVAAWNRYVAAGADPDFEREKEGPMHPIAKPPFHALAIMVVWHGSYGGLRVNGRRQVIDMQGQVIPGLYAGGEAAGGFDKHGLGKGTVQGYIAGTQAAAAGA
jgi:hypothetical protein